MKVEKVVTPDIITIKVWGTEDEIKTYFRKAQIIPSKQIIIQTYAQTKAPSK